MTATRLIRLSMFVLVLTGIAFVACGPDFNQDDAGSLSRKDGGDGHPMSGTP